MALGSFSVPYAGLISGIQPGGAGTAMTSAVVLVDQNGNFLFIAGNPGVVSAQDGGLATVGSLADAAYGGSGNGSLVTLLKGVYALGAAQTLAKPSAAGGSTTQAATGSAVALASQACSEVYVQNSNASAGLLLCGIGAAVMELQPGQGFSFQVQNANQVQIKLGAGVASATANVTWRQ